MRNARDIGLFTTAFGAWTSGFVMKYSMDNLSVEALFWSVGTWVVVGGLGVYLNMKD